MTELRFQNYRFASHTNEFNSTENTYKFFFSVTRSGINVQKVSKILEIIQFPQKLLVIIFFRVLIRIDINFLLNFTDVLTVFPRFL